MSKVTAHSIKTLLVPMTLLESIIQAVEAADTSDLSPFSTNTIPIILNPNDIFPNLKEDSESLTSPPIVRVSGWSISKSDSSIIESISLFSQTLKDKLQQSHSVDQAEFLKLLSAFLQSLGENLGLGFNSEEASSYSIDFLRSAIQKIGIFIGREAASLVINACVVLELWELVEALIVKGLVENLCSTNILEKLCEHNQSRLLCLCAKHITDLRPSELLIILRFFLSPPDNAYDGFLEMRKEWESQALLAIGKATEKGVPKKAAKLARDAAILLMLAHDGFSATELCLHFVFGSSHIDALVLSSVIKRLNGSEILSLIRYFGKWLKKYERFPESRPCPQAKLVLSLNACEDIPSFDSVVKALSLILDEHFSHLVLNSEFHDNVRDIHEVVNDLASEANASGPVYAILKHLKKSQLRKNGSLQVVAV